MKPKSACRGLVILPILTFATSVTSGGHESFLLAETLKHSTFSQDHPTRSTSKQPCSLRKHTPLRRTW
jgi:hypothetical protein